MKVEINNLDAFIKLTNQKNMKNQNGKKILNLDIIYST